MKSSLAVKLLASPTQLTMAERSKFMIGVEVVNRGAVDVDPRLSTDCVLTVNGERSMSWSMAIGNAAHDETWDKLPPGKATSISWPLGDELFEQPGDYRLVMTLGGEQATADIHVTR